MTNPINTSTGGFVLSAEQRAIAQAADAFVREHLPVSHLRMLRDTDDSAGHASSVWRDMAELGWAGVMVAEDHGGAALSVFEAGLIAEQCGKTLAPTPFLATAVLAPSSLRRSGTALTNKLLVKVADGTATVALAFEEHDRFKPPTCIKTRAVRVDGGWRLTGRKRHVLDGSFADYLVVAACVDDGLGLFLIPADTTGVVLERRRLVDSRAIADVALDAAFLSDECLVVAPGHAEEALCTAIDCGTAVLSAEMLGGAQAAFDATLQYLKERIQFGVPIGSFQALKHRAARMFCELELLTSVVRSALFAMSTAAADRATLVSAAKARACDTFGLVAAEAIQMHGGIGVTDELDIGLYYKRARVAELTFGDAAYHRNRFGILCGY